MAERGRRRAQDSAATDLVSTLLLVAMVVLIGGVVAVAVTGTLSGPPPSPASFSLRPPDEGDTSLVLQYRHGEPLPLDALGLAIARDGSGWEDAPRALWSTPDPVTLRPGEALRLALVDPVAADESLRVQVVRRDANLLLAELAGRAGLALESLAAPTLLASASPDSIPADGASLARLTVRVSHPQGALSVAAVSADVSEIARAAGVAHAPVALGDDGEGGDLVGGDGVWSATFAAPRSTPAGTYGITFNATDASGRFAGTALAQLSTTVPAATLSSTGEDGSTVASAGASYIGPTSENVTKFRIFNWTWDKLHPERLDGDFVTLRVSGGGKAWSGRVSLQENLGGAYATELLVWHDTRETLYRPDGGTHLGGGVYGHALDGLVVDLLDPLGTGWKVAQHAPDPESLYQNAGITVQPTFVVPYFGHDVTTGNAESSISTGIISVEVVFV